MRKLLGEVISLGVFGVAVIVLALGSSTAVDIVFAQDKPADEKAEVKAAQSTDISALNKRIDALEKQLTTLVTQTAPTADAQQQKLSKGYKQYFESAKRTPEYVACREAGGRPVVKIASGAGSVECEKRR